MPCQGIRGATTAPENTAMAIIEATRELLQALSEANDLRPADIASAFFTATPDLDAAFPARAARELGWADVALLDAVEMAVPGALPRCIRVLVHANTDRPPHAVQHVYLREAVRLRPDRVPCRPLSPDGSHASAAAPGPALENPLQPAIETHIQPVPGGKLMPVTVAYQGEPGAYSQEAIVQHFGPEVQTHACHSFDEIFAAVEGCRVDLGLLPVENSQAGSINSAYDLLLEHDLRVVGEVKLRVRHCLLAPPGTRVEDIRRVHSHPQALAQCERYLKTRGWEAVPAYDTAGAARELAGSGETGAAAIASALAGQTYGLEVLDSGIEDAADNTTRFFLIGTEEPARTENSKTSLVFSTAHTPGSLYRALGEFANRGINMAKIESRPRRNRPWQYVFYVDVEGHWQDSAIEQALVGLLVRAAYVKLLGSYPAAPDPAGK